MLPAPSTATVSISSNSMPEPSDLADFNVSKPYRRGLPPSSSTKRHLENLSGR
jgi:hypothetical protein